MGHESDARVLVETRPPRSTPEATDEHRAFNNRVGEAIRRARQERGWTQAVLAERARLSPNYVARLERGELGPSLFVASHICEALAIPVDELVGAPASSGIVGQTTKKITRRGRAAG